MQAARNLLQARPDTVNMRDSVCDTQFMRTHFELSWFSGRTTKESREFTGLKIFLVIELLRFLHVFLQACILACAKRAQKRTKTALTHPPCMRPLQLGMAALHYAALGGNESIVKLLLDEYGADVNIVTARFSSAEI